MHPSDRPPSLPISPLILVGASVRAAAEIACQAFHPVYAWDHFGDADLMRLGVRWQPFAELNCRRLLEQVESLPSRVPVIMTGGVEQLPQQLRQQQTGLHRSVSDISGRRSIANAADCHFPPSILWQDTCEDFRHSLASENWIIKHSSGFGGMHIWNPSIETIDSCQQACDPASLYFQQVVPGIAMGASFLACTSGNVRLLGICQAQSRASEPHPFQYCGSRGPLPAADHALEQLQRLAEEVVRYSGHRGLFGIDVLIDGDKIWFLEANLRWTASMEIIALAHSFNDDDANNLDATNLDATNLIVAHVREVLSNEDTADDIPRSRPAPVSTNTCFEKRIVYAPHNITVTEQTLRQAIVASTHLAPPPGFLENPMMDRSDWWIADIPKPGTHVRSGDPLCTLLRRH